jgi:hypothetical protein
LGSDILITENSDENEFFEKIKIPNDKLGQNNKINIGSRDNSMSDSDILEDEGDLKLVSDGINSISIRVDAIMKKFESKIT